MDVQALLAELFGRIPDEIRLAVESGELDGVCFIWASMRTCWRDALEGRVVVLLQVAPRPLPGLAHVPLAVDLG